ncbi:MAG TPA: bacillithiol biosynthesis cysteine-adding enzyme BshC [candidate division Zixibacteria bacterium]|nr:bacillithiol biosynthesis cysteine-adding enzyme BshC [candidate division Zixibacteria bacterium]HEQ99516.1 bacillithiol biosynthesis cysteine-adding enzyme BshC [candidate division Zixibacteria bacterium]
MGCRTLSYNEIKGTSQLFKDFLFDFKKVAPYYCADFKDLDRFRGKASKLAESFYARTELADILLDQNRQYGLGQKSLENVEKLKDEKSCVVFTGQQVGMLTGPLYTIYKTLTSIKLANLLESEIGIPVIPIFWLAADDHDFEEVRHVYIIDKGGKPVRIYYEPESDLGDVPMGFVKCDKKINTFLDEVLEALPKTEYSDDVERKVRESYREGTLLVDAFGKMLGKFFENSGLVIVNPSDIRVKQLAAPIYAREIEEYESSNQIISIANTELDSLGYHLQVHHREDYLNLFYYSGKRVRIGHNHEGYFIDGVDRKYTREELIDAVHQSPVYFSPNVLLRPVTQDYLFPTLAYIAGPAEDAYFAQIKDLHGHFDVECPIVFPRISATILDRHATKTLDKYELKLPDLMDDRSLQAAIKEIVEEQVPDEVMEKFDEGREEITSRILEFEKYLENLDEGVRKTVHKTKGRVDYELKSLQEKIVKAYKKKNDNVVRAVQKCADFVFPEASLQERHLNVLTFINKYGPDFIDRISEHLKLDAYDHQVLCLEDIGY